MTKLRTPGIVLPIFFNIAVLGAARSLGHGWSDDLHVMALFLALVAPWLVSFGVAWISEYMAREDEKRRREKENSDFV